MRIDANEVTRDTTVAVDLCVVGGGMAGIAIARELRGSGLRVAVLESGVESFDGATQSLYDGAAKLEDGHGNTLDISRYLRTSRMRLLGGSGNAWGAKCGVLDETDFEARDWLPGSGWPVSRAALGGFYDRACDVLQIPHFDYDPATEFDPGRPPLRLGDDGGFVTATRHLSPVSSLDIESFRAYRGSILAIEGIDVYLRANVTEIRLDERGERVESVEVRTLGGNRFQIRAEAFVLATGGIENARLLLLSDRQAPGGLGNRNDLVGRYFGGHVTFGLGSRLYLPSLERSIDLYTTRDPARIWGVLATSPAKQRAARLPNFTVTMSPPEAIEEEDSEAAEVARMSIVRLAPDGRETDTSSEVVPTYFMSEQVPNPDSRISLGSERDALGQRRVQLTWRFEEHDFEALGRSIRVLASQLGGAAAGRLRAEASTDDLLGALNMSRHHIGSTRMSIDPRNGVVDPDCRVHGIANLYVAGSSVFPTTGIVNPTLTLIALALRLTDHLRTELAA